MKPISLDSWESICEKFQNSPLAKSPLSELAKEWGLKWPINRSNETPSKYLHYTWEELLTVPTLKSKPQRRDLLLKILRLNLDYDDELDWMETAIETPKHRLTAPTIQSFETPKSEAIEATPDLTTQDRSFQEPTEPTLPTGREQSEPPIAEEPEDTVETDPVSPEEATPAATEEEHTEDNTPAAAIEDTDEEIDWENFDFENDESPLPASSVIDPLAILRSKDEEEKTSALPTADSPPPTEAEATEPEPISEDNDQPLEATITESDPIEATETQAPPTVEHTPPEPREVNNTEGIISDSMFAALEEWNIPLTYPVELMGLTPKDRLFCKNIEAETLQDIIAYYEKEEETVSLLAKDEKECPSEIHIKSFCRNIFIGNENEVAEVLPIRLNHKGIHLPEAILLLIRSFPRQYQAVLLNRMGNEAMLECCDEGIDSTREDVKDIEIEYLTKMKQLLEWFPQDKEMLWNLWSQGEPSEEHFSHYEETRHRKAAAKSISLIFASTEEGREIIKTRKEWFQTWVDEISELTLRDQEDLNLIHYLAGKQKVNLLEEFALYGKKNNYFEYSFVNREFIPGADLYHIDETKTFCELYCEKNNCNDDVYEKRLLTSLMKRGSVTLPFFISLKRSGFETEKEIIKRVGSARTFRQFEREVDNCFKEAESHLGEAGQSNLSFGKDALLKVGKKFFT